MFSKQTGSHLELGLSWNILPPHMPYAFLIAVGTGFLS